MSAYSMLEQILSKVPLPGLDDGNEQNDSFRDYLYRSARRKEDLLEMMIQAGGAQALHDAMAIDPETVNPELFNAFMKKADLMLKAVDKLSVSLPTTSFAHVQAETRHIRSKDDDLPPPRHIPHEELMQANLLYLEGKEEEKAFKKKIQDQQLQNQQTVDVPAEVRR